MTSNNALIFKLAIIASLGGFLFGYDTAVVSGTVGFVKAQFELNSVALGWYVSSALVGCILGVVVAGVASDKFGRKPLLIASGILFGASALGCMVANGYVDLAWYRFIGGIGVGVASMLSPLYISEIAPAERRGSLVALYQFAITLGILCAYFANAYVLHLSQTLQLTVGDSFWSFVISEEPWRAMLGSELVPALIFFMLLCFIPRSPRWLLANGKQQQAEVVLASLYSQSEVEEQVKDIQDLIHNESGKFSDVFNGGFRFALFLGMALAFLTQISGINAIIYYGPTILEEAGLKLGDALGGQVIIGIVNVVFTLLAIWKIDSLGRRPLLLIGVSGILISLFATGLVFYLDINNTSLLMAFILMFIACFAFSYGPVIWVFLSEIYPTSVRGTAMSIATLTLWIGTWFVGQVTPWLLENLKPHGTFWFFFVTTIPALYIALKLMPETKGKSLEQIEQYWLAKSK